MNLSSVSEVISDVESRVLVASGGGNIRLELDSDRNEIDLLSNVKTCCKGPERSISITPALCADGLPLSGRFMVTTCFIDGFQLKAKEVNSLVEKAISGNFEIGVGKENATGSENADSTRQVTARKRPVPSVKSFFSFEKEPIEMAALLRLVNYFFTVFNGDLVAPIQAATFSPKRSGASFENKNAILVSIEGNIGAGKSTLLKRLRADHPDWVFIDEPVDTWTSLTQEDGKNLLQAFYEDKVRWAYTFQNVALLSRFKNIESCITKKMSTTTGPVVFVTERCLDTDHEVFAKMLCADGTMSKLEYDLYQRWFNLLGTSATPLSAIIYCNTTPSVCAERICVRNRKGEEGIPLPYLEDLDRFQRNWVSGSNLPVLEIESQEGDKVTPFLADIIMERTATSRAMVDKEQKFFPTEMLATPHAPTQVFMR